MPFPFRHICDLLQRLEDEVKLAKKPTSSSQTIIQEWFREHRVRLDAPDVDVSSILSTLLPERRTDRVYGIQVLTLEGIFGSAQSLAAARLRILRQYKTPGIGHDLGDCVENILNITPNAKQAIEVTVEEIDETLHRLAAACRFSSPAVKGYDATGAPKADKNDLKQFYQRLTARDAKWFTRLVLKNYQPVALDGNVVLRAYHPSLPQLLSVQEDFSKAASLIQDLKQSSKGHVSREMLKPVLGTKVGRQPWIKGRSIKHCADMIGKRQISCEQKIDGEYCQIHVDLRKPVRNAIQIFSKSGKDSTKDREGLHSAIRDSLKLGQQDCKLNAGCILEGELVVYSTKYQKIMPFHKIRKHVSRSGSFLGTLADSQRHYHEHLMIIYYDVLMVDDQSLLEGFAEFVKRQIIPYSGRDASQRLRELFAKCITTNGEGLVLKPDDPYFNFTPKWKRYGSCCIKLKKEYIQGWGDVGDFAVVGASYNAAKAKTYNIPKLRYTEFFIGCLENRDEARACAERPRYMVTNIVELSETLMKTFRTYCNPAAVPLDQNSFIELDFQGIGNSRAPSEVFPDPPVFDMRCFSFDKEPNSNTWSMRFPTVSKIHFDRSFLDVMTFDELQQAASTEREAPELEDSQQLRLWVSKLEQVDRRGKHAAIDSQSSVSTVLTTTTHASSTSETSNGNPSDPIVPAVDAEIINGYSDGKASGVAAPEQWIATPPMLSAARKSDGHSAVTPSLKKAERRKRHSEPSAINISPKRKKRRSSQESGQTTQPLQSYSVGATSSPTENREPLGAINGNSSSQDQRLGLDISARSPVEPDVLSPTLEGYFPTVTTSFHIAGGHQSSPPTCTPIRENTHRVTQSKPNIIREPQPSTGCGHSKVETKCAFDDHSFLVSPCISQYAWIADLLQSHGVLSFVVDPSSWAHQPSSEPSSPALEAGTMTPVAGTSRSTRKSRIRKVCLVEVRRPAATKDFLQRIEAAGLKRRNGQREWIPVYDWRILEDFTSIESGVAHKGLDPWRHRYVGIA
ncbi:uncharacterized protein JN550_006779 [Neoarthrinium moseri]|uniref:uncharacterized protein n=1 Tax=Neoarthrinium moseri TaxID=1658444 RepID=UPI001FDAD64B|nr:uncharacterized protein JN550_006779 [Neoarthrinium moseri]KAI1867972.1 hypothetical protein JN550_006779 [Neoarthrinium moseri]